MRLREKVALLALPAATLAVTLSDFRSDSDTMNESDIPLSCLKVYKADITGCSPSDFTPEGCSSGCVTALQSMRAKVETACGSGDLQGTGILTVFLRGNGPGAICAGAAASADGDSPESTVTDTTEATSSTSTTQISTRSSSSHKTSSTATSASSTASLSGTVTASSLVPTSTGGGILVDTSSAAVPTATSRGGGAPSSSNDHSGQGSPFDTQSVVTGGVMPMASLSLTTLLVTAVTVLYAAL